MVLGASSANKDSSLRAQRGRISNICDLIFVLVRATLLHSSVMLLGAQLAFQRPKDRSRLYFLKQNRTAMDFVRKKKQVEGRLRDEIMIRLPGAACSPTQEEGEVISVYLRFRACLCPFTGNVSSCAFFPPLGQK